MAFTARGLKFPHIFAATSFLTPLVVACQTVPAPAAPSPQAEIVAPHASAAQAEMQNSADLNAATALLMQWWDIFEAPFGSDRSVVFDQIFSDDVVLHMEAGDLKGPQAISSAMQALPETSGRSHHLHHVQLTKLDEDRYRLEAKFEYQIARLDGSVEAGISAYAHTLKRLADGRLVLEDITAEVLEPIETASFNPSYQLNRARGALAYYLATTDALDGPYSELSRVLSDKAEIIGMIDPNQERFNPRGDGVLRGQAEISAWLASRGESFDGVAHRIDAISIEPLATDRYAVEAEIMTRAWPKTGDPIAVTLPIRLEMIETGDVFMRIDKIIR